jgi:hypothetical protein
MGRCLRVLSVLMALSFAGNAHADSKLARIFDREMLNVQIAYLESITGPAMHVNDILGVQYRDYRIEGCKLLVYAKGSEVVGYTLSLSPKCNFNLGNFLGSGYSSTNGLTVGGFINGGLGQGMRVQSGCIYMCGNAADPAVDFTYEGPHALGFISIVLSITLAGGPSLDAVDLWEKAMRSREREDYILNTRFNCDRKYDAIAIRAFSNVPVDQITVGYEPMAGFYNRSCSN